MASCASRGRKARSSIGCRRISPSRSVTGRCACSDRTKRARPVRLHGLRNACWPTWRTASQAGFSQTLEIIGVGYRAEARGQALHLSLGYSHPILFQLPPGRAGAGRAPDDHHAGEHRSPDAGRDRGDDSRGCGPPSRTRARASSMRAKCCGARPERPRARQEQAEHGISAETTGTYAPASARSEALARHRRLPAPERLSQRQAHLRAGDLGSDRPHAWLPLRHCRRR